MSRSSATLTDTRRFVEAVQRASGAVPERITALLSAADILMTARPIHAAVSAIVDELTSGRVDAIKLDEMLSAGAHQQLVDTFRGDVSRHAEPVIIQKLHRAFADGCADDVLASLRGRFDEAAGQIAEARSLIPAEQPAEEFLATATPKAVKAWQALPKAIATCEQIAGIASKFGCRPATTLYPLIEPYALGDGASIDDRALFCGGGPSLVIDSAPFGRPGGAGRSSPWFQVTPLMLHTVASARERYRIWAADQWEAANSGPRNSVIGPDGEYHELPKPPNPYRDKDAA